ncbi:exonuclease mut-7-like protein [Cucumis melo var. makuwa]|uniref:Exonuclease mut-7-like protein n=1 Tax=Cucumis melo var. makuwa TaxID=1194695 RepID=A0A5D3CH52_CUCMM|nr:exonuclease mut-7-like protein [Cucumis melo var. makuwa]
MDSHNAGPAFEIHVVSSIDSPEFTLLTHTLTHSHLIALDAEWKPLQTPDQRSFPRVSLLQIACQFHSDHRNDSVAFLLDLLSVPLSSIWHLLRDVFVSPYVLKLGFRFKQDLVYLSTTFSSYGGGVSGLDRIEPFMDIASIYYHLQHKQKGRKLHKQSKSLAAICSELLGFSLSKELQCSDWSVRPLTEEQIAYAAMDAHCLLEIFNVFYSKVLKEGDLLRNVSAVPSTEMNTGLKVILEKQDMHKKILRTKVSEASNIIRATASGFPQSMANIRGNCSASSSINCMPMDEDLQKVVKSYGERIVLKESDKKPKISKRKGKRSSTMKVGCSEKQIVSDEDWLGPPPWDLSLGGDGCPKFLCDVMVEGLAKHLRCVGVDAAVPFSKNPYSRELIDQAHKEKRVLLTRDAKLLRHGYLLRNQIYRVKNLLKNEQLLEVIETFNLKISEDQLMSRCTKCNGRFIQKSLTTEEAVQAAKGFQKIPNCLFDQNLEFWQCMDCHQLYWEGIQYRNAVQKFIDVCKLND